MSKKLTTRIAAVVIAVSGVVGLSATTATAVTGSAATNRCVSCWDIK